MFNRDIQKVQVLLYKLFTQLKRVIAKAEYLQNISWIHYVSRKIFLHKADKIYINTRQLIWELCRKAYFVLHIHSRTYMFAENYVLSRYFNNAGNIVTNKICRVS